MQGRTLVVALLLFIASAVTSGVGAPPDRPSPEENILREADVPADGDGLLSFFRRRTLSDAESKQIGDLIRRLGGDHFDDRESAAKALRKIGARARPLVKAAALDSDLEIACQARRFLSEIKPLAREPAMATARLLARRAPADAVSVLLAYLPFADDAAVEDEIYGALLALTPQGKADPALVAALDDAQPAKRSGAAYVLGRKGDDDQRAAVRKRLEDAEALVRWQAAAALLTAHDRAAVPGLVKLLADGPFDTAWRAEKVMRRLAGDTAPPFALGDSAETRGKCRDAWAAWWKEKGNSVNLARYEEPEQLLGYTLGVEYNTSRVWECDIDGSIRWEIRDLAGPMDAQVLPNGNVLIAEADAHRVTERDLKGVVKWEKKIDGEPNGCRRLLNGNTFVSTPMRVMEFGLDDATVFSYKLNGGPANSGAVHKRRDGLIYYAISKEIAEYDTSAKPTDTILKPIRGIKLPLPRDGAPCTCVEYLPGDRYLAADMRQGSVLEVDATGKVLWQADVPGACGAERLPNGHTLVALNHKVIELDGAGKQVWAKETEGYVRRAYRR